MDAASASAAAEALEATLQADLVGLRAQLRTEVLDVDGQQEGRPAVVAVRDVDELEAEEAQLAATQARLAEFSRAVHGVNQLSEVECIVRLAELEAQLEGDLLMQQEARERSHATAVAAAGPHRRRRRRP